MSIFSEQKIYWIGPRESDIAAVKDLFAGSITIFGSNENGNASFCNYNDHPSRIDHNNTSKDSDNFLIDKAREYIARDKNVKFMLYNGNIYNTIDGFKQLQEEYNCIYCVNDADLMVKMNDKHYFHELLEGKADILHIESCNIADCDYDNVCGKLDAKDCRFIIQAPVASGGSGTFILDSVNGDEIQKRADPYKNYLVSVYQENNVSANIHAIIYDDDIIFSPGSVQIMKEDDYRLMYRGADFVAYRGLDKDLRARFESQALIACKEFQKQGYRGVCGIDAIFANGKVLLLEVNNRYQSSTNLLNMALRENKLPSIQELNYEAFYNKTPSAAARKIHDAVVNYSNFAYVYTGTNMHSDAILERSKNNPHVVSVDMDGYHPYCKMYANISHLFRVNFNTNITWVNEDHILNLHENIIDPAKDWVYKIRHGSENEKNLLALKVALMTQGVRFTDAAAEYLEQNGGFRPATNNAIDLFVDRMIVNAPINIKFVEFTPFTLDVQKAENGEYQKVLLYYGEKLMRVNNFPNDEMQNKTTSRGVKYSKVAYLSTDRLRVHISNHCKFKKSGVGCKFCNMETDDEQFTLDDIREVVADYRQNNPHVKHYLIGGQSAEDEVASDMIVETIKIIRELDRQGHIYAMVLPVDMKTIDDMRDAGLDELACNIEIFDAELAVKYMPGKGKIPREKYMEALKYAAVRQDFLGDTRSLVVVGLEPLKSMYDGITKLANNDIQPILSVFRPLPDTALADLVPPSMKSLCEIYEKATAICAKSGLRLGPSCVFCQNNTLSMRY